MTGDDLRTGGGGPPASYGALSGWVRWAYLPLLAAFTAAVFLIFLLDSDVNKELHARVSRLMDGTAHRPFAYRALLPILTETTTALLPSPVRDSLARAITPTPPDQMALSVIRIEPGVEVETVILYGWIGLFLFLFAWTIEPLFRAAAGLSTPWTRLSPFIALLGLPPFFQFAYFYDLPMLALSTLALLLMVRRRWPAYFVVLALACLNKETAVLFPVVFALHFFNKERMERRLFWRLLPAQAAVAILIRLGLMAAYAGRPGFVVENHLLDMLALNFKAYALEKGLAWGLVALAVVFEWRGKPAFLKSGLAMLIPLYASFVVFGYPREIRVFYEVYPVVFCMALIPFMKRMQEP